MDRPWVSHGLGPWVTHGSSMRLPCVFRGSCISPQWVFHGKPMFNSTRQRVAHGLLVVAHGSPTGIPWDSRGFPGDTHKLRRKTAQQYPYKRKQMRIGAFSNLSAEWRCAGGAEGARMSMGCFRPENIHIPSARCYKVAGMKTGSLDFVRTVLRTTYLLLREFLTTPYICYTTPFELLSLLLGTNYLETE